MPVTAKDQDHQRFRRRSFLLATDPFLKAEQIEVRSAIPVDSKEEIFKKCVFVCEGEGCDQRYDKRNWSKEAADDATKKAFCEKRDERDKCEEKRGKEQRRKTRK
jgi:hypothetical protein